MLSPAGRGAGKAFRGAHYGGNVGVGTIWGRNAAGDFGTLRAWREQGRKNTGDRGLHRGGADGISLCGLSLCLASCGEAAVVGDGEAEVLIGIDRGIVDADFV